MALKSRIKNSVPATPTEFQDDGLPQAGTVQTISYLSLAWLIVAPPGWGKTTLAANFPETLMLSCEGGHKFITTPKLIIDCWEGSGQDVDSDGNIHVSFMEAVSRIEKSERYKMIFIDTLDALVRKCIDHHIGEANQAHLSDLGEYGKGYDLGQNDPIRKAINRLLATGRGLSISTHQFIANSNFKKGTQAKKETSLPAGIFKIVFPQVDLIVHGEYGGIREGNKYKDRILRSQGDEDILAKNRGGVLPASWILPEDPTACAEQIESFFNPDPSLRKAAIEAATAEYEEFYK